MWRQRISDLTFILFYFPAWIWSCFPKCSTCPWSWVWQEGEKEKKETQKEDCLAERQIVSLRFGQHMPELNILVFILQKGRNLTSHFPLRLLLLSFYVFIYLAGTGGVFIKPLIHVYISWRRIILVNVLTFFLIPIIIQTEIHEKVAVQLMNNRSCKITPCLRSLFSFLLCSLSSKPNRFWLCLYKICQLCILISVLREKKVLSCAILLLTFFIVFLLYKYCVILSDRRY